MLVGDPPDLCVAYPGRAEVRGVSMGNFHDCGAAKCGATECARGCKSDRQCAGFTLVVDQGYCFLFSSFDGSEVTTDPKTFGDTPAVPTPRRRGAACAAVVLCVHERRLRRPPPSARAYVEGMSAARAHRQSLANGSGRGDKL